MQKEFDIWNEHKKEVERRTDRVLYREREIRWCKLGVNIGFEQDGTGDGHSRPVLIIKAFNQHVCLVVPLTTSTKDNPYHIHLGLIDGRDSFAIISQLRLIDTRRMNQKIQTLKESDFIRIIKAVKDML